MGLEDPGLWVAASMFSTAMLAAAKLLHAKIKADRDRALAEMALRDSKPEERSAILESLAELRPFNPRAPRDSEPDEPSLPTRLPALKRRR